MYLAACQRRGRESGLSFDSPEEQYDYAISLLNTGFYEEARDHFRGILITNPGADYAYYGLAILESMTGLADSSLKHLAKAIELSPRSRIPARKDSDFKTRFTCRFRARFRCAENGKQFTVFRPHGELSENLDTLGHNHGQRG
jgi:tetratricopeptide (TPR) repeat protein